VAASSQGFRFFGNFLGYKISFVRAAIRSSAVPDAGVFAGRFRSGENRKTLPSVITVIELASGN
jgi:hypothetical protein